MRYQRNPRDLSDTALAPYNFVPLPRRVFSVESGVDVGGESVKLWQCHDRYVPGTSSGWIDLEIEALTPIYIRGPVPGSAGQWDARDGRLRPAPYSRADGTPVIPGSSLRGMVRNLVEILAFSKIQPVTDERPFFRTVANDRIGKVYRSKMIKGQRKPPGGFLHIENESATITPCEVLRVDRSTLQKQGLSIPGGPSYSPPWPPQHGRCWVKRGEGSDRVSAIEIQDERPKADGWQAGTLVLTGNAPRKKREFVFLDPPREAGTGVRVSDAVWKRFHDADQITQWQERAYPRNKPTDRCRPRNGHLRGGEPVFYLLDDDGKLAFLGRAQMFRLPYEKSPAQLVPDALRDAPLDLAQALFGRVKRNAGDAGSTIKGRLCFEDAVATGAPPDGDWREPVLVPRILSTPKPTTFQHYLVQDGSRDQIPLSTYLEQDKTTIRGHKLYWHRWDPKTGIELVREPDGHDAKLAALTGGDAQATTQHTVIQPVKARVRFEGRIRFENLADIELGALLHALRLPESCAHKIGMGKPLGLGSVRIEARLTRTDPAVRHQSWSEDGRTQSAGDRFVKAFQDAMLGHARSSGEALIPDAEGLRQIARLDALYRLLEWQQPPGWANTRAMVIENGDGNRFRADKKNNTVNEFRTRPVLPTPHAVAGASEPHWPPDGRTTERASRSSARPPARQAEPPTGESAPRPAAKLPKPVNTGQQRKGTLHRVDGNWIARFEGDQRDAALVNPGALPDGIREGRAAELYITRENKRDGILARFERLIEEGS